MTSVSETTIKTLEEDEDEVCQLFIATGHALDVAQ